LVLKNRVYFSKKIVKNGYENESCCIVQWGEKELVLFSKDSTYALYTAKQQGLYVKYLVTIFPERKDSWMFHHPCIELTKLQAKSLGISHITRRSKGDKEKELEDLRKVLETVKDEVEGIVSGGVESTYQKSRIDKVCKELNLKSFSPLWHRNPEELLKEEVNSGFEIIISSVSTAGLDKNWLGRKIDMKAIEELKELHRKHGFHLAFEGGDAESLVLDCPIFKNRIKILDSKTVWDDKTSSGYLIVKKAILVEK